MKKHLLIPLLLLTACGLNAEVVWEWEMKGDHVQDVVTMPKGDTCLLFRQKGPYLLKKGENEPQPMGLEPKPNSSFLSAFKTPGADGDLKVLCRANNGYDLWAGQEGKWNLVSSIEDNLDNPFCFQSGDGAIWLYSWEGVIYRFNGGKVEKKEYTERVDETKSSYSYYQPLRYAETENNVICFFTQFSSRGRKKSIKELLVYNGKWNKLPFEKQLPGGGCFIDERNLLLLTEKGLVQVDTVAGGEPTNFAPLPGSPDVFQHPVFLRKLPDGTIVTLWALRRSGWSAAPTYKDGSYSRMAEYDGKKWKTLNMKVDSQSWDSYEIIRPSVVDSDGSLWMATAGNGIMRRKANGKWDQFGWRQGMNLPEPTRLAVAPGNRVWIVDKDGACVLFDPKTKKGPKDKNGSPWSKMAFRAELKEGPDGALYGVTDEKGGSVVRFGDKGPEYFPIPPELGFRVEKMYYMSFDSENSIWLFGGITLDKTAVYNGKEWKVYSPNKEKGLHFHDKEIAFQAQLGKGGKYRIGNPKDQYYVQYTDDGKILYQNEWRRACYFDGKMWHSPYGSYEVDKSTLSDHPFFHDGKVTVVVGEKFYQMENDAWSNGVDDRDKRAWKKIQPVPHPCSMKSSARDHNPSIPNNCPIMQNRSKWTITNDGWTWVGAWGTIACSPGTNWIVISTKNSPLNGGKRVSEILSDANGRWFFKVGNHRPTTYAVYKAAQLSVEPGISDMGRIERPFEKLTPGWKTKTPAEDLLLRYRVDDSDWSDLLPAAPLDVGIISRQGRHELALELYGKKKLMRGPVLKYSMDITYNADTMMEDLIKQLGAPTFKQRKLATETLILFGKKALPQIEKHMNTKDPEIRERLILIKEKIQ